MVIFINQHGHAPAQKAIWKSLFPMLVKIVRYYVLQRVSDFMRKRERVRWRNCNGEVNFDKMMVIYINQH